MPDENAKTRAASSTRSSRWLARRRRWVLAVIIVASVAVRIAYFASLRDTPCFWMHGWTQSDMNFFDLWARDIAGGDWLTNKPLYPRHWWHRDLARDYFSKFPAEVARFGGDASNPDVGASPERRLWEHWLGGKRYYQEPLYPFLVGLVYRVLTPHVGWVFALQLVLGVFGNILIWLIARRMFGDVVALVAAALAVFCSPLLFYEMTLLRVTAVNCAGLGIVYLLTMRGRPRSPLRWFLTGLLFGLAVLLKVVFVFFLLGYLAALAFGRRRPLRLRAARAGLVVAGFALGIVPLAARNIALGVSPLGLAGGNAMVFVLANARDVPVDRVFPASPLAPEVLAKSDARFLPTVVETLRTHENPWSYARMLWAKCAATWHWYEIPNNTCFYYYQLHAPVLRLLPVTFRILGPLAIVGLLLALPRRRRTAPLLLLVVTHILSLLVGYVASRFRAPMTAAVIPLAALAIVGLADQVRRKRFAATAALAVAIALAACWTWRPLPEDRRLIPAVYYQVACEAYYVPLARRLAEQRQWRQAESLLARAIALEPDDVRSLSAARPPRDESEQALARLFGTLHAMRADALARSGFPDAAKPIHQRATELRQLAPAPDLATTTSATKTRSEPARRRH